MKIQPLGDHVLIELINKEEHQKTASGIVIPDTAEKDRLEKGLVLEIGGGTRNKDGGMIPLMVSKGQMIYFRKPYGAEEIKMGDKTCLIIKEEDILAIIEE